MHEDMLRFSGQGGVCVHVCVVVRYVYIQTQENARACVSVQAFVPPSLRVC